MLIGEEYANCLFCADAVATVVMFDGSLPSLSVDGGVPLRLLSPGILCCVRSKGKNTRVSRLQSRLLLGIRKVKIRATTDRRALVLGWYEVEPIQPNQASVC